MLLDGVLDSEEPQPSGIPPRVQSINEGEKA